MWMWMRMMSWIEIWHWEIMWVGLVQIGMVWDCKVSDLLHDASLGLLVDCVGLRLGME
jgi:hypothetical protein